MVWSVRLYNGLLCTRTFQRVSSSYSHCRYWRMLFRSHLWQQCHVFKHRWIVHMHLWQRLHWWWPHLSRYSVSQISPVSILHWQNLSWFVNNSNSVVYYFHWSWTKRSKLFFYLFIYITDIDECALNTHDCHPNAQCTNTIASFTCHCDHSAHFYGNGKACYPHSKSF